MPTILIDPSPRTLNLICDAPTRAKLESLGHLIIHETGLMPDAMVDQHLERDHFKLRRSQHL